MQPKPQAQRRWVIVNASSKRFRLCAEDQTESLDGQSLMHKPSVAFCSSWVVKTREEVTSSSVHRPNMCSISPSDSLAANTQCVWNGQDWTRTTPPLTLWVCCIYSQICSHTKRTFSGNLQDDKWILNVNTPLKIKVSKGRGVQTVMQLKDHFWNLSGNKTFFNLNVKNILNI